MAGVCGVAWMHRERGARCVAEMGRRLAAGRATQVTLLEGRSVALAHCGMPEAGFQGDVARAAGGELLCVVDGWFFDDPCTQRPAVRVINDYLGGGAAALGGYRGQYSIALWDGRERSLRLVSDRLGSRNLYWTLCAGDFVFTSELRGLVATPGLRLRADDEGIAEFLTFGYCLEDRTLLDGVRLLMPGSILTLLNGGVRIERWWTADMGEGRRAGRLSECVEELAQHMQQAVRRRSQGCARVGLGLSGGRDSRVLAGLLAERRDVACTAYAFNEDEPLGEGRVARLVAEASGLAFERVEIPRDNLAARMDECGWQSDGFINTCEFRTVAETAARDQALFWAIAAAELTALPMHPEL